MRTFVIGCFVILVLVSLGLPFLSPVPPLSGREGAQVPREQQLDKLSGVWHRTSEGETLRSIATQYYGSTRQWRTLQIANSVALVPSPNTRLWIPGLRDEIDALDDLALHDSPKP